MNENDPVTQANPYVRIVINGRYTYYAPREFNVAVGDTVTLPPGKPGGRNWPGTVTAIGSTYDGPTKQILSVMKKGKL